MMRERSQTFQSFAVEVKWFDKGPKDLKVFQLRSNDARKVPNVSNFYSCCQMMRERSKTFQSFLLQDLWVFHFICTNLTLTIVIQMFLAFMDWPWTGLHPLHPKGDRMTSKLTSEVSWGRWSQNSHPFFNPGPWNLACILLIALPRSWLFWDRPLFPRRPKEVIINFDMLKIMEGVVFQGSTIKLKLISNIDLRRPDDLIFDLRGHLRLWRGDWKFHFF